VDVPLWHIHRAVGMGGDRLDAHVSGDDVERRHGDDIRSVWEDEFDQIISEVRPFEDARAIVVEVAMRGFKVVLASSGKRKHVETFLDLVGVKDSIDGWTTAEDADQSKPAPDLLEVAVKKVGGTSAVMIGDSTWDCKAADNLGAETLALRNGGFSREELFDAGAFDVYGSLVELRVNLDDTPLSSP
jgi:HAD superfamily hydrolase (TIGR01549 family)